MIGKKLKELIKLRNLKQIKLAKYVGISPSRLSNYLSDKREPDLQLLAKMARYLAVDLNYFTDVRFPSKKDATYGLPPVEDSVALEGKAAYSDDATICNIPYLSINSKKRAMKSKFIPFSRVLLGGIKDPEENVVFFDVTTSIGGAEFAQGDYVVAAKFDVANATNGTMVFKTGRNGKFYRYLDDKGTRMLLSDSQEIISLNDESELGDYYAVQWIMKKP